MAGYVEADHDYGESSEWELLETEDGYRYYYNNRTQESQWYTEEWQESAVVAETDSGDPNDDTITDDNDTDYYQPETEDEFDSFEDAVESSSPPQGLSDHFSPASSPARATPSPKKTLNPRPGEDDVWEMRQTQEGATFYYNTRTQASQWIRPTGGIVVPMAPSESPSREATTASPPQKEISMVPITNLVAMRSERDVAMARSDEYKARLQVAESQIMAIFESKDKEQTDAGDMWRRRASQLLKTQQSLTGMLATKTRAVSKLEQTIEHLSRQLEELEMEVANNTPVPKANHAANHNKAKMDDMIRAVTSQFEREKHSVVTQFQNQLSQERHAAAEERQRHHTRMADAQYRWGEERSLLEAQVREARSHEPTGWDEEKRTLQQRIEALSKDVEHYQRQALGAGDVGMVPVLDETALKAAVLAEFKEERDRMYVHVNAFNEKKRALEEAQAFIKYALEEKGKSPEAGNIRFSETERHNLVERHEAEMAQKETERHALVEQYEQERVQYRSSMEDLLEKHEARKLDWHAQWNRERAEFIHRIEELTAEKERLQQQAAESTGDLTERLRRAQLEAKSAVEEETLQVKDELRQARSDHAKKMAMVTQQHQQSLEEVRQQMREEASAALKQLTDLTKLETEMQLESIQAKHDAEILRLRGDHAKLERQLVEDKLRSSLTSAEEFHPAGGQ